MPDFYKVARKILFALDAERAHHLTLSGMRLAERLRLLQAFIGKPPVPSEGMGPVTVMGLTFPNRVGLAAGMDKAGVAVDAFGAVGFGHVEVGTVTPRAQPGNEIPRLFRLKEYEAIINRMGFNNPGIDQVLKNLRKRRRFKGILGINIGKNFDTPNERALDDYAACLRKAYPVADYITANLSSPNTKGLRDLQAADVCRAMIQSLHQERERLTRTHERFVPIAVKIAPDLTPEHIDELATVFTETAVDAVIATNTTIDKSSVAGHPLAQEAGGLSGAPLRDRSSEVIRQLRKTLDPAIPIIGAGGILSAADAQEKFDAGAALVQIYTGLVYRGPALVHEILRK